MPFLRFALILFSTPDFLRPTRGWIDPRPNISVGAQKKGVSWLLRILSAGHSSILINFASWKNNLPRQQGTNPRDEPAQSYYDIHVFIYGILRLSFALKRIRLQCPLSLGESPKRAPLVAIRLSQYSLHRKTFFHRSLPSSPSVPLVRCVPSQALWRSCSATTKILLESPYQIQPHRCIDPQSGQDRLNLGWYLCLPHRRTMASRPIQQHQIIREGHVQKSFVAGAHSARAWLRA